MSGSGDHGGLSARFERAWSALERGDARAARTAFEALRVDAPQHPAVHNALGAALMTLGEVREAIAAFRRAADLAPGEPSVLANLARALLAIGRAQESLDTALRAAALAPGDPDALRARGAAELELERYEDACRSFGRLLEAVPGDPGATAGLARALVFLRRGEDALALCDDACERDPDSALAHAAKGLVLRQLGRPLEAVACFEQALRLDPGFVDARNNLGAALLDLGRGERALECFEQVLAQAPALPQALFNVVRTRRNLEQHRPQIERMEGLVAGGTLSVSDQVSLHFALGKAFDDLAEYERAFAHYERGNAIKRRTAVFDAQAWLRRVSDLIDTFTARYFERVRGFGLPSERPVFIVGMPRSGTTLVEQILASHPRVFGGGELAEISALTRVMTPGAGTDTAYPRAASVLDAATSIALAQRYLARLEALDPAAARVTDKMPANFAHLGFIATLFPNAHVIHCRRDPVDTCLSNYFQLFGMGHHYSYSLSDIAIYHRAYERLMAHWRDVLPLAVHEVSYESLVQDQEPVSRDLVAFTGLDWDPACLSFHRNERAVHTASHWQVRQPIYRGAQQRWRHYERYLSELREALGRA